MNREKAAVTHTKYYSSIYLGWGADENHEIISESTACARDSNPIPPELLIRKLCGDVVSTSLPEQW
jgi:hypothetical protein